MHILLVADGRSPTSQSWMRGLLAMGYRVSLISTYPCQPIPQIDRLSILPVAFARLAGSSSQKGQAGTGGTNGEIRQQLRRWMGHFRGIFMTGRYFIGPLSVSSIKTGAKFRKLIDDAQPDLVHALRIPFEGMLASYGYPEIPLILSIWGNDLTLHAQGSAWMAGLTRRSLKTAWGLMADAQRDITLAAAWGFDAQKPALVVPGSGGVDLEGIARAALPLDDGLLKSLPHGARLLVNPRGYRPGSLRSDTFFKAIPLVLQRFPEAVFLCPAMADEADARRWVNQLGIQKSVRLLPKMSQTQVWSIFHQAEVFISPSVHDGMPNSFLEALACGCFPVVGNIASFKEWIEPDVNGLLFDATDPRDLADCLLKALTSTDLRQEAKAINVELIDQRAGIQQVRPKIAAFYNRFSRESSEK